MASSPSSFFFCLLSLAASSTTTSAFNNQNVKVPRIVFGGDVSPSTAGQTQDMSVDPSQQERKPFAPYNENNNIGGRQYATMMMYEPLFEPSFVGDYESHADDIYYQRRREGIPRDDDIPLYYSGRPNSYRRKNNDLYQTNSNYATYHQFDGYSNGRNRYSSSSPAYDIQAAPRQQRNYNRHRVYMDDSRYHHSSAPYEYTYPRYENRSPRSNYNNDGFNLEYDDYEGTTTAPKYYVDRVTGQQFQNPDYIAVQGVKGF